MIGRIENINSSIGDVKIVASRVRKNLPKLNSLVKIEVLEKLKGKYKILVNGELYQSKLPIKASERDIIMAQLINLNPVTLKLDAFNANQLVTSGAIGIILKELGITKTTLAEKLIEKLLKTNKHLSKEKIKRFLDYAENSHHKLDELQFGLLIAMIWDDSDSGSFTEKRAIFNTIFDISFWSVGNQIYKNVVTLKGLGIPQDLDEMINNKLIFSCKNFEKEKILSGISSKVRNYIELTDSIEEKISKDFVDADIRINLISLSELLIKYILQKSLLNKYKIYVDFVIANSDNGLRLWEFSYYKIFNKFGEPVYKMESSSNEGNLSVDFDLFLIGDKLRGKVETSNIKDGNIIKLKSGLQKVLSSQIAGRTDLNWIKRSSDLINVAGSYR